MFWNVPPSHASHDGTFWFVQYIGMLISNFRTLLFFFNQLK